jgi:hypothetical protein
LMISDSILLNLIDIYSILMMADAVEYT